MAPLAGKMSKKRKLDRKITVQIVRVNAHLLALYPLLLLVWDYLPGEPGGRPGARNFIAYR